MPQSHLDTLDVYFDFNNGDDPHHKRYLVGELFKNPYEAADAAVRWATKQIAAGYEETATLRMYLNGHVWAHEHINPKEAA